MLCQRPYEVRLFNLLKKKAVRDSAVFAGWRIFKLSQAQKSSKLQEYEQKQASTAFGLVASGKAKKVVQKRFLGQKSK